MCSWAQTSPVCQSISFQNETCGTPGKVGWCLVCSGFILLFYTYTSWFHMFLFCQWIGDFAIWISEKWDCGVLTSISQAFSPFLFFTCDQRFRSYKNAQVWAEINFISGILFLLIIFLPFLTITPKKYFFHFSLIFACFDSGDPVRESKSWLCIVSKRHSHSQRVPSTWKMQKYLQQPNVFSNPVQYFCYHL